MGHCLQLVGFSILIGGKGNGFGRITRLFVFEKKELFIAC
jgi:hypothetical protein